MLVRSIFESTLAPKLIRGLLSLYVQLTHRNTFLLLFMAAECVNTATVDSADAGQGVSADVITN